MKGKEKGSGKRGHVIRAAIAKFEPPKPEVLTKEGLHRRVDELLGVSEMVKSDSYSPVILPKWEYDSLVRDSERLKEHLMGHAAGPKVPAKKTDPKKAPSICLVTDEFRKFQEGGKDNGQGVPV